MKRNWKRLLSSVLALVMVLAMLPVSALADGATTSDVKTGYYADGKWTEGTPQDQTLPAGVTKVSKTAKKTADNTYEVTLEVQMEETSTTSAPGSAATVLAIDCSGSMAWCAICGKSEYSCTCKNNETYEFVKVTVPLDTRKNYYVLVGSKYVQVKYCDGGIGLRHWVAENHDAVWYDVTLNNFEHRNATRYTNEGAGKVVFYEYKSTTSGKTFVSRINTARDAAIEFLQSYSGFADSDFDNSGKVKTGTQNLGYGRYVAVVLFASNVSSTITWCDVSTVSGYNTVYSAIAKMNANGGTNLDAALQKAKSLLEQNTVKDCAKHVIALTDGQPTYYLDNNGQTKGDGSSCSKETFEKTIESATAVRSIPATLWTICFATNNETMTDYSRPQNSGRDTSYPHTITLANYLKSKIATTGSDYQASEADEVATAFKAISKTITSGLSAGTVTDSLPIGVSVATGTTGTFESTWTLTAENAAKSAVGNKTTYTWTKTYTVTIDPMTAAVDSNGYTPLNGQTTLTVGTGNETVAFPIPAGKVTYPSHTVSYNWGTAPTNVYDASGDEVTLALPASGTYEQNATYTVDSKYTSATVVYTHDDYGNKNGTYTFSGWKDTDGTVMTGTKTMGDTDVKLTGIWLKSGSTLTYVLNGGTISTDADYTNAGYVATGTEIDTPTNTEITYTGYTFDGWCTDANCTIKAAEDLKMPAEDLTLYAKWIPSGDTAYKVEHYKQNIDGSYPAMASVTENKTGTTGATATATENTYTGFTYDEDNTNNVTSDTIKADGSLVLKLYYTRNEYTVEGKIDSNGTITGTATQKVKYEGRSTAITFKANDGYEITNVSVKVGDNDPSTPIDFNSMSNAKSYTYPVQTVKDNITVTVTTTALEDVTFTYMAVDGDFNETTTNGAVRQDYGDAVPGSKFSEYSNPDTNELCGATAVAKPGYEFKGWYTDGTGNDIGKHVLVTDKENLAEGWTLIMPLTNSTYYAKFEPTKGTATVTFKIENGKWSDGSTADKTVTVNLSAGKGTLDSEDVPTGMTANENYENGSWDTTPNTTANAITGSVTYTYTFTMKEVVPNPGLSVTKTLTSVNGKTYTSGKVEVGDVLVWTITVENTGNTTLNDVVVIDQFDNAAAGMLKSDDFVNGIYTIESLESGASESIAVSYTVQKSDAGKTIVNRAFAEIRKGGEIDPDAPSDEGTSTVEVKKIEQKVEEKPSLSVSKWVDDDNPKVGDTIEYTIAVENTGNVDLYDITVTDELDGAAGEIDVYDLPRGVTYNERKGTFAINVLAVDETVEITYSYKVLMADWGKTLTNSVTVRSDAKTRTDSVDVEVDDLLIAANAISRPALNTRDHVAYIIGYVDGTVRPENDITRSEVAAIFFRLLTDSSRSAWWSQSNSYSDVSADAWYNNAVSTLSNAGIITGYTDGTFRPDQPITRAEFATIAARFSDVVYGGSATFPDVPATYWAYKYISLAQYLGWVQGMPDGNFYPEKNITRAEAITMINRVLDRDVEQGNMLGNMVTWTDNTPDKWYYEAVQEATNSHLYSRGYIYATGQDFFTEIWRSIKENPDWAALEKAWSTANSK